MVIELPNEDAELDFVRGVYPTGYRNIRPDEDISGYAPRHILYRSLKPTDNLNSIHPTHLREEGEEVQVASRVPSGYSGLEPRDRVVMMLGGSGDNLCFALARMGEQIGSTVSRIPPFVYQREAQDEFGNRDKEKDAENLANLWLRSPSLFYDIRPRDLNAFIRSNQTVN